MNDKIFIGIDGGGTKTTAVAADENGCFLAAVQSGSINFSALGMDEARHNMKIIVDKLNACLGTDEFYSVYIGMSAIEKQATDAELHSFCDGIIKARFIGMHSDAFVALNGMNTDEAAVLVISGTGSMVIGKDADGRLYTSGGWGYILGDEGSGYDIALKGLRAAVRSLDIKSSTTALSTEALSFFKADSLYSLADIVYNGSFSRSSLASFCQRVCICAQNGDEKAKLILKSSAYDLSLNVNHLLNITFSKRLGIYGGVFEHSPLFTAFFAEYIPNDINIAFPEFPAHTGALLASYTQCGIDKKSITCNIKKTFADGIRI